MGVLTEFYRRYLIFRYKPRRWLLRPGTIDRRIFRSVVIDNEYQLPGSFDPQDIILDIGAHVGSFTYAALKRGATTIFCCEANPDNVRLLQHNLQPYLPRVRLVSRAIWRSDQAIADLPFGNPGDIRNTGAGMVVGGGTHTVPVLAFDDLITEATEGGRRIRLAKLDCEGAEWPILLTSRVLDRVDALCGEYHLHDLPELFQVPGYPEFTPALLEKYLGEQGFQVHTQPAIKQPEHFGLFFAERASQLAA